MSPLKFSYNAWLISLLIFIYNLLLQVENIVQKISHSASPNQGGQELFKFFLGQYENVFFLVVFFFLLSWLNLYKIGRWIGFILSLLILLYYTIDQVFYSVYFDHIRYGFDPEGQSFSPSMLWDSVISFLDRYFVVHMFCITLLSWWFYKRLIRMEREDKNLVSYKALVTALIYIVVSFGIIKIIFDEPGTIYHNPFFTFTESLFTDNIQVQTDKKVEFKELYQGISSSKNTSDLPLTNYVNAQAQRVKPPNVIYVVLESVGAFGILENGELSEQLTPSLYKLKEQSILFPVIYNTFPATTRSHMPIITGGYTLTYGSVFHEMILPYAGPTLVSSFKESGYNTALFTAQFMDFEAIGDFYQSKPFDVKFMPDKMKKSYTDLHKLNSWGIDELEPYSAMKEWIEHKRDMSKPFFVEFMNLGTHHPYSIPNHYKGPYAGTDDLSKYKNAIHYTDYIIGRIVEDLKKNNLYENTIICISGDHGEAFGDRHYQNFLHKNYLYEENIRNFFLLIDPAKKGPQLISQKQGFIGDIMPSMLGYAGVKYGPVKGQNLFSEKYENRIHFFYKSSFPELWGLVDGEWKFIIHKIENKFPELYNLREDPLEQHNLAEKFPERIEQYSKKLPYWYIQSNKEFVDRLKDYKISDYNVLSVQDIQSYGPKSLMLGNVNALKEFTERSRVHPEEKIFTYIKLIPYPEDVHLKCVWESPSGIITEQDFYVDHEWTTAWKSFERKAPMEEGTWTCSIRKDGVVLKENSITVSKQEPLQERYSYETGPVKLFIGIRDNKGFIPLEEFHPKETIIAFSQINPFEKNTMLVYKWESPSGKKYFYTVPCEKNWNYTWLVLNEDAPMEEGLWTVSIWQHNKERAHSYFEVSSKAKLYFPFQP